MFDVARRFELVKLDLDNHVTRHEVRSHEQDPVAKTKRIVELGPRVLIYGAISWPLEAMLVSGAVGVLPNTCRMVDDVAAAFIAGDVTEHAFLIPGCTGRHRRHSHRHRRGNRGSDT